MEHPTTIEAGCRKLVEGLSFSREEAQREVGAEMLEALMSKGLAWSKGGRYAATDAGRRAAAAVDEQA